VEFLGVFPLEVHSLRPLIDATWNAAGFAQSTNYDKQGNWKA
jgi:hypothetical protein